jgi:ATP-binding cassette subfamily B protein
VPGYHRHLLGLPLSFFSSRPVAEIISRLDDAIKIGVAIGATTISIMVDAILVVTTASIMMLLDWPLTLRSVWFIPAFAWGAWRLNRPMKRHRRAAMKKGAQLEAEIVETIGAIREIKTFRAGPRLQMKMNARFSQMQDDIFQAQRWAGHATTVSSVMAGLSVLVRRPRSRRGPHDDRAVDGVLHDARHNPRTDRAARQREPFHPRTASLLPSA